MRIVLLLLFIPLISFSQKKDTIFKYLNSNLEFTNVKNASFYGVAIKQEDHWYLLAVYADTTPLIKAYYKDRDLKIKNGPYTLYFPKHIKAKQGYYSNNKMSGVWRTWHPNGQIKDSGLVINDRMFGTWKSWFENGQLMSETSFKKDLTENDLLLLKIQDAKIPEPPFLNVRSGSFNSYYNNGNIEASGSFENDLMVGEWRWYHENGNLSTIENYKNGKLDNLQCYDTTGTLTGDFCSIEKPAYLKKYGNYKEHIYRNLVWPAEAIKKRIEGEVKVSFTITKNGELTNLNILSEHAILKKAVEEFFKEMNDWSPAIYHNKAVDFKDAFVIPFYIRQ